MAPWHDEASTPSQSGRPRLQKVLARAGVASRRHAEELIAAGRVAVNETVVRALGTRIDPSRDRVAVDGRPVGRVREHVYLALNKPLGVLTTADDPQGRPTVMGLVPPMPGLFPVGRLDADSEGLLLLTTDGEWAQRVVHPRYGCEKEYVADVEGSPSFGALAALRRPLELVPGEWSTGIEVQILRRFPEVTRLRVVLREGRNRQIRRLFDLIGHPVQRLVRVRIGPVLLVDVRSGRWRRLTDDEVGQLAENGAAARLVTSPSNRGLRPSVGAKHSPVQPTLYNGSPANASPFTAGDDDLAPLPGDAFAYRLWSSGGTQANASPLQPRRVTAGSTPSTSARLARSPSRLGKPGARTAGGGVRSTRTVRLRSKPA